MNRMPWFRLYSRIMTDPKIEMLAFEDQRHFVWLLCMKNEGYLDEEFPEPAMLDRMVGRKLGLQGESLENTKLRLVRVGLINEDWQPVSWADLQFVSDQDPTRNERQKRYREKKQRYGNALHNAPCNAQVTRLDSDAETYKEKDDLAVSTTSSCSENTSVSTIEQHASLPDALQTERKKSKPKKRLDSTMTLSDEWIAEAKRLNPHCTPAKLFAEFVDHHTSRGNTMADWLAAWRTWIRNDLKFSARHAAKPFPAASDWSPPRHRRI